MRLILLCALGACTAEVAVTTHIYDDRRPTAELDVFALPDPLGRARPAVLYAHGGGWRSGERANDELTAQRLARAGYVAVNLDYRLVPEGTFPVAVQDVFCALAYVRARATELAIDPDRIAVMGHSAGGHLMGLVGVAADVPALQDGGCPSGTTTAAAAVVSGAGPMDLIALGSSITAEFVGASFAEDPARWALASPLSHVAADEPPFLFIHAEHDLIVPIEQSEQMLAALRAAGNTARFLRLEGGGHVLGEGLGLGQEQLELSTDTPEAWMALLDFLAESVGAP